jgi:hypothetical protein
VLWLAATAHAASLTVTRTDDPNSPTCTASNCSLPLVTGVSQSPSKWRDGTKLASFARTRPPIGTVFSFTLDQPATLVLAFSHQVTGRCGRRHEHGKHPRHCSRTVRDGTITFQASAGRHSVSFDGVISRRKRLGHGLYAVAIIGTHSAGKSSLSKTLRFTIVLSLGPPRRDSVGR